MKKIKKADRLLFESRSAELVLVALRWAIVEGYSYRGFLVGCAALAFNGHEYKIFGGANMKPRRNGQKACAELQALNNALKAGYYKIIALVVVGEPQEDPTLHPCDECRLLLKDLYRLSKHTIIHTRTFEEDGLTEMFSFSGLLEFHGATKRMR